MQYGSEAQKRSDDVNELGLIKASNIYRKIKLQSQHLYKILVIKCQKTETPAECGPVC